MSRRRQTKKQRRKCPDFRSQDVSAGKLKAKTEDPLPPKNSPKHKRNISPDRPKDKKGIPFLSDHELPGKLFGVTEEEAPFSQVIDQALAQPEIQEVLQETLSSRAETEQKQPAQPPAHHLIPESELDLHGATGPEAEVRTQAFISSAYHKHLHSLRIITGKGLHSENSPVLPDVVESTVLELKKKGVIRSFRWEKKDKLKSGAILVFLN